MTARIALVLLAAAFVAGASAGSPRGVPGEKLDSGLGELPPYAEWAAHPVLVRYTASELEAARRDPHHVVGEKIDSGLGEIPPYREWHAHPELRRYAMATLVVSR